MCLAYYLVTCLSGGDSALDQEADTSKTANTTFLFVTCNLNI
ncbi:MAG: hypothetical protein TECD_00551 [Hyphomicrobiaceae bacterium hypho_1]